MDICTIFIQTLNVNYIEKETLSRLQKLICKLFKITPENSYIIELEFLAKSEAFLVGDLINTNGEVFYITQSDDNHYVAKTVGSVKYRISEPNKVILYARSNKEVGSKKKTYNFLDNN